jgi:hypothetical protein
VDLSVFESVRVCKFEEPGSVRRHHLTFRTLDSS